MSTTARDRLAIGPAFAPVAALLALAGCGSAPLDATTLDPTNLASGLVAHWTFDEGTGSTAADTSGNGHDGVLVGGSWNPSGRFGSALELAYGNYVSVADFPQATASWTVSVWSRSSPSDLAAMTTDPSTVISTETVFAGGWQVHLDNRPNHQYFDAAYWAGTTVNDYVVLYCTLCVVPDVWIHLTTVWDAASGKMILYRDDQVVDQRAVPGPILTGDTTLYLGTWNRADTPRFLVGDLDDVAIWRRALDPTEIAALGRHSPSP